MIYLDSNATTSIAPQVLEAMLPFLREHFANPSGICRAARVVKRAIATARGQVAALLGAHEEEIVFTSGGTESCNAALHSALALFPERQTIALSTVEHSAVRLAALACQRELQWCSADENAGLNLADWAEKLEKNPPAMAQIMWANNETGIVSPVAAACEAAHRAGALFHCDAVQAVGKIHVDVDEIPVDYLSLSGHKIHAPKGIGALFISRRVRFRPMIHGGGQENGRRSGTENVAGIVALGKAAELAALALANGEMGRVRALRDQFESTLAVQLPMVSFTGSTEKRLPNTSHVHFSGIEAEGLLFLLDKAGICASAGSSCRSGSTEASPVLLAMGRTAKAAKECLRFSFNRNNTEEETKRAVEEIVRAVKKYEV